jgi:anti-sigma regulatory factor (Ser/Thr protein kinase)
MGDVVGRGIEAAARMAHLQSAVRAYALEGLRPSIILERMNGFVQELETRGTATLLLALVDPDAETVRLASAAHPPPLMVDPDGATSYAEGPAGNPLGASLFPSYEETVLAMPAGSSLVLYTDGLVERPDQTLDEGLGILAETGSLLPEDPDEACRALLDRLLLDGRAHDDVGLLVARLDAPPAALDLVVPADPSSLVGVRRGLGRWLRASGVGDAEAYELQVACGEACANAIAHAYPPGEAHFAVRAERDKYELTIEVADYGAWRPPRGGTGGRGLALIEQLTDSLEIDRGVAGTTVRMRRRMKGALA